MTVRASIGTLGVLSIRNIRMEAVPTTAYLMIGSRCTGDCAYCGQGRSFQGSPGHLSRISWPEVSEESLLSAFVAHHGIFERVCLQATASPGVMRALLSFIPRISRASAAPVSVSYRVRNSEEASRLFAAGAQRLGVAIDCCSARLYPQVRGGTLACETALVKELAAQFPGRISTHLIIGLGEAEEEAAELILDLQRADVLVSLFAFTPVRGTRMADAAPPALLSYRRLQALVALLDGTVSVALSYDDRRAIHSYGLSEERLRAALSGRFPFATHGCPGCNRPFYTESPGGTMYNFPGVPASRDEEVDRFIRCLTAEGFDFGER